MISGTSPFPSRYQSFTGILFLPVSFSTTMASSSPSNDSTFFFFFLDSAFALFLPNSTASPLKCSATLLSKSVPPNRLFPTVAKTSVTPPPTSNTETSKVPPPKSNTSINSSSSSKWAFSSDAAPYASAAASGSGSNLTLGTPANSDARIVARRWDSVKYAGTPMTARVTLADAAADDASPFRRRWSRSAVSYNLRSMHADICSGRSSTSSVVVASIVLASSVEGGFMLHASKAGSSLACSNCLCNFGNSPSFLFFHLLTCCFFLFFFFFPFLGLVDFSNMSKAASKLSRLSKLSKL
mmetsp:Transcript_4423/g.9917  ORF Transcript_4423/g.9917 Transcript_4423/m.9917 type:complete len:297 (+) Transcript_4423:1202-2092(+)